MPTDGCKEGLELAAIDGREDGLELTVIVGREDGSELALIDGRGVGASEINRSGHQDLQEQGHRLMSSLTSSSE